MARLLRGGVLLGGSLGILAAFVPLPRLQLAIEPLPAGSVRVSFVDLPAWVTPTLEDHLVSISTRALGGREPTRGALRAVRETLLASGGFASVEQVGRETLEHVVIRAHLREPVVMVRDGTGTVLVDATGRRLPDAWRAADETAWITLRHPRAPRPRHAGAAWPSADVHAALRLLGSTRDEPWLVEIRSINLQAFDEALTLVLETATGFRIVWGAPPGEEAPLEAPGAAKSVRLRSLVRSGSGLERLGVRELDLRDPNVVVTRR